LGHRGTQSISGIHFCITFNEEGHLVLSDSSTWGTAVSYSGQAVHEVRRHFTWILNLQKENGRWDVEVHVPQKDALAFKIELAQHAASNANYKNKVKKFIMNRQNSLPELDVLGINSHITTAQPSQPFTPRRHPIYISERKLGAGSWGEVDLVINVSTGVTYARKRFYQPTWRGNKNQVRQQKAEWLERIRREIRIMRDNPHVSMH
jgi:serine/threonine protein kinase